MKEIEVKELIVSRLSGRGKGTPNSPFRTLLQIFEKDGVLLAEKDDFGVFTYEDLLSFGIFLLQKIETPRDSEYVLEKLKEWNHDKSSRT